MKPEYIIVQAGGKGTRMEHLTANKPKALVPVGNRPMLFHLFEKYPDKKFIVIADYKSDVMKKYLAAFASVKYLVVETHGKKGTCSGISAALDIVPDGEPFLLIWSDLVLSDDFKLPERAGNYVGLSTGFKCRWRYEGGKFEEIASENTGVAGAFLFTDKSAICGVPDEGEFVKWLAGRDIAFDTFALTRAKEYGLIDVWRKDNGSASVSGRCRPFNKMTVNGDVIVKEGVDDQGRALAKREIAWYKYVADFGYSRIPKIYSFEPLAMQKIDGKNIYEYDLSADEKKRVLIKLVDALKELHTFGSVPADRFSVYDAYIGKTFKRLDKIRDLVPFADRKYITVNGRKCRNVYFFKDELSDAFEGYVCPKFTFIHGDNTFSNMMLDKDFEPVMIDPRGYFGYTELFGDPNYDWVKLYYSIAGNYDMFNLKRFRLTVGEDDVTLDIDSNGWENMADCYLSLISSDIDEKQIKLLHAVVWLSLTTYAWEDYDSVVGAFYNGIYHLEEALSL